MKHREYRKIVLVKQNQHKNLTKETQLLNFVETPLLSMQNFEKHKPWE